MQRSRSSVSPVEFYEREVLPALFASLDRVFPEFGWKRDRQGWVATKPVAGVDARADRVVCHKPFGFYVHGGEPTTWLSHVSGGRKPTGKDFVDAVRDLAERAGVDASPLDRELSSDERAAWEKREKKVGTLEAFLATTRRALLGNEGAAARAYLVSRGFTVEGLAELELGLYTKPADVKRSLMVAGSTEDEVVAAGLTDARWEGRLVGAMRDRFGRLETFFARDLAGAEPKYLYLKDATKPAVFGLDVALRTKEGLENLVLVEGVLDVVLLHAKGFSSVAAIGGATLSTENLEKLREAGVRRVTLALDYDLSDKGFPGLEGTRSTVGNAHKGDNVPVVYAVHPNELQKAAGTPEGQKVDPDSLVRQKGLQAFRDVLTKAEPGALFLVRSALGNVSPESADRQEVAVRALDLVDSLRGDRGPLDREDALKLVAERTGYPVEAVREVAASNAEKKTKAEKERELRRIGEDVNRGLADGADAGKLAQEAKARLERLTTDAVSAPPPFSVERLYLETKNMPPGRTSGWSALDAIGVEFYPGELTVVGARTGHCKTTFLVGLLANWLREADAEDSDELFVFYSSEEAEVRIFHRLLALLTCGLSPNQRWSSKEIRAYFRGGLGAYGENYGWPAEEELEKAKELLASWEDRLLVVHEPRWDVDTIAAHARGLSERRPIGGVFVDYLQRIRAPEGSYDRRDIEVSHVARSLKSLAVGLSVPVVTGAQINREAAKEVDRTKIVGKTYQEATGEIRKGRPELHHLREGGSEQEADTILGLLNYRADFATDANAPAPKTTLVEAGTLKSRYGEVGKWAGLAFEGRFHLLRNVEEHEKKELAVEATTRTSEEVLQVRRDRTAATEKRTMASLQKTDKQLEIERLRHEREKMVLERARLQAKPETSPEDP